MIGLIARKEGMSRVFTDEGKSVPVTVLKIHSNIVSQIKTSEKDGYDAIQISAVEQSEKNQSKAEIGHLKKNNISFKKLSQEFSLNINEGENLDIGSEIKADIFAPKTVYKSTPSLNKNINREIIKPWAIADLNVKSKPSTG